MSLLRSWTEHRALQAARRHADEQLLASRLPSPRLAWRAAELTSAEHRNELGRALTDAVHTADERFLPGARPLNRGAVRDVRAQLLELASCLFDGERAVSARAVLLTERLLADGGGPLYGDQAARKLRLRVEEIREAVGA
ncbi:MAG TPA: hypothetical protein VFU51_10050 [Gaiellaceae bacterium]|nr:hypothetical protein [Gaiellaceae bacterium]